LTIKLGFVPRFVGSPLGLEIEYEPLSEGMQPLKLRVQAKHRRFVASTLSEQGDLGPTSLFVWEGEGNHLATPRRCGKLPPTPQPLTPKPGGANGLRRGQPSLLLQIHYIVFELRCLIGVQIKIS